MEMVAGDGPVAQLEVRLGRAADQLDILGQRELFAGVDPAGDDQWWQRLLLHAESRGCT